MTQAPAPGRVFVVGAPRSGTTLVQSLLASHSALTSFTESHFYSGHYRFVRGTRIVFLRSDPRARLREFLHANEADDLRPSGGLLAVPEGQALGRLRLLLGTREAARDFIETLDRLARRRGAAYWLEKTPMHLRYCSLIDSATRQDRPARFVHVIRDGLEVVASLRAASRSWARAYGVRECARRWNDDLEMSIARIDSPHDRFVLYEGLTGDPESTLRPLLDWIGLDWQPAILEEYGRTAVDLIRVDETWKAGVERRISTSRTADKRLTSEERDAAQAILRAELYETLRARALGTTADR